MTIDVQISLSTRRPSRHIHFTISLNGSPTTLLDGEMVVPVSEFIELMLRLRPDRISIYQEMVNQDVLEEVKKKLPRNCLVLY